MTGKEKMSEKGVDLRLWLLSVIAVVSVGFGLGVVLQNKDEATTQDDVIKAKPLSSFTTTKDTFSPHHLLYDMENVDKEFLKSTKRIQQAIDKTLGALKLDLRSSACHESDDGSYSCQLVMEQGHGTIQAFPENGVLTMDLALNHNHQSLLPAVDIIKEHFAIGGDAVTSVWTIDFRGQQLSKITNHQITMSSAVFVHKKLLFSGRTKYHQVDVWQTKGADARPVHEDVLKYNLQPGDPRWTTNELAPIDVEVYVDGNFVVSSGGDEELDYELDIHTVMMAHPNPKRVGAISAIGDAGPHLQQILRHDIDSVTMFQRDEEFVNLVKKYMPTAFDCTKIEGLADDCVSDNRVTWIKQAGWDWFQEHYGENSQAGQVFDVVIADAHRPEKADILAGYVESIFKSLSGNGVFGVNLGMAPTILHPRMEYGFYAKHDKLIQTLEGLPDVEAIMVFDDDNSLNDEGAEVAPTGWLIACKSASCRDEFFAGPQVVNSKLASRIVRARNGRKLPKYFDGVVNHRLQTAPKSFETIYCRRDPIPFECNFRNLDFSREIFNYSENEHESAFSIQRDDSNPDAVQQRVIATVDIPAGSYIMPSDVSKSVIVDSSVLDQVQGSGAPSCNTEGSIVEIGPSNLIRSVSSEEEANVGQWVPPHPNGKRPKYSPVYDNHGHSFDVFLVATRNISKGDELVRYSRTK